jgi:hypothetical protein
MGVADAIVCHVARHESDADLSRPSVPAPGLSRLGIAFLIAVCGLALSLSLAKETNSAGPIIVRVAPDGSDTCTRSASSGPCLSLGRAYAIVRPGDVVRVAAGDYVAQRIMRGSQSQSGPAISFQCATRHACIVDGLVLGQNNGSTSGDPPNYVTFDGIDVSGEIFGFYNQNTDPQPTHITIENGHVWSLDDASGGLISLPDEDTVAIRNMEIGPACCNADGLDMTVARFGAPSPSNITVDRSFIHDIYDSCTHVPPAITSAYGACSGTGYEDNCASCAHTDGSQWYGGNNVLIENNRIVNVNAGFAVGQGLFMQEANGGTFSNVTIVNNMFASTPNNDVSMSGPGMGSWSGYLHVYYNTIQGNLRLYGGPGSQIFRPGTAIVITGNIIGNLASAYGNSCSVMLSNGSVYTPTYGHNLNGNQACSKTDLVGRATFVAESAAIPDLRLRPGSRGLALGSLDLHPRKDIDGHWRPVRWPSDLGAAQLETALVVPGVSVGGARLGMDQAAITELYGRPNRLQNASPPLARVASYRVHGAFLYVGFDSGGRVVRLSTTSRYYSTAAGVGPAADVAIERLRRHRCAGGSGWLTLRGSTTDVELQGGVGRATARITRISVGLPGYGFCRVTGSR